MSAIFCSDTGAYLACPTKPVRHVGQLLVTWRNELLIWLEPDEQPMQFAPELIASVVQVATHRPNLLVVETTNSVYVGRPFRAC